jgi:hypothetical protein
MRKTKNESTSAEYAIYPCSCMQYRIHSSGPIQVPTIRCIPQPLSRCNSFLPDLRRRGIQSRFEIAFRRVADRSKFTYQYPATARFLFRNNERQIGSSISQFIVGTSHLSTSSQFPEPCSIRADHDDLSRPLQSEPTWLNRPSFFIEPIEFGIVIIRPLERDDPPPLPSGE